jgi:8-oxo-dGTP pyrophosphatase MutT (NUDIX family)
MKSFKTLLLESEENRRVSTGIIAYYVKGNTPKIFMAYTHPYVMNIDNEGNEEIAEPSEWTFPKGLLKGSDKLKNARHEFKEEIGFDLPSEESLYEPLPPINDIVYGKTIYYYAYEVPKDQVSSFKFVPLDKEDPKQASRFMQFRQRATGKVFLIPETDDGKFHDLDFLKAGSARISYDAKETYDHLTKMINK